MTPAPGPTPEPITSILRSYCSVNALVLVDFLAADIRDGKIKPAKADLFRQQLDDAINQQTISPQQYKAITGENEYTTPEALREWLCELRDIAFPDSPP